MTFNEPRLTELQRQSHQYTFEEAKAMVAMFLRDDRFACVFTLANHLIDEAGYQASDPKNAGNHGALAHAGGYRYGLESFLCTFSQCLADERQRATNAQQVPGV